MDDPLPAKLELFDQLAVLGAVLQAQVIEQATAVADQLEQSLARAKVLAMRFKVRGELTDAFGEESDLHGRATRIGSVALEPLDRLLFDFFG
jgi:hypothetical protein